MSDGFIKLHRKILENVLWKEKPFTKGQAWVDILLNASYVKSEFWVRGISVNTEPGQCAMSQKTMAKRWGWSRCKVQTFLNFLEKNVHQIRQEKNNVCCLITILNWPEYQEKRHKNRQEIGTRKAPDRHNQEGKEGKEGKEGNKPMADDYRSKSFATWTKADLSASVSEENHDGLLLPAEVDNFVEYWTEPTAKGKTLMSLQKSWATRRRMQNAVKMIYSKERPVVKQKPKIETPTRNNLNAPDEMSSEVREKALDVLRSITSGTIGDCD